MTWIIEVEPDDVVTGPLHGELAAIVSDALNNYRPGYASRVRVTWRDDNKNGA